MNKQMKLAVLLMGTIVTAVAMWQLITRGDFSDRPGSAEMNAVAHGESVVRQIVDSEELILFLNDEIRALSQSVMNLQLPDESARELFLDEVALRPWSLSSGSTAIANVARDSLSIWPQALGELKYFKHAKFYMIKGHFRGESEKEFQSEVGFAALARTSNERWRAIEATCRVDWKRLDEGVNAWKISGWETVRFSVRDSDKLMFRDRLDQLVDDPELKQSLRHTRHLDYISEMMMTGGVNLPNPRWNKYFRFQQNGQHPGLAVVDFDNDGWDDLYVCDEWRANRMLKNIQGKRLVDVAPEIGLDLGPTTSAIFADFDNDGDQDAFIGCVFEPVRFMVNEGGHYVDRTENITTPLPKLTTSISAADYNNDGLLDVYISTYGFPSGRMDSEARMWLSEFLTREEINVMRRAADQEHRVLNALGPPNLLLMNTGDASFRRAPVNDQVRLHHNTFQSVFCDYDGDGDQDLYVSNDFAPDFLFRNDGEQGFTDVTREVGGEEMLGFGMGASWADYDLDGDYDLYVSNMYSKAGKRITHQIDGLDDRFYRMASGNRLFRNDGEKFTLVREQTGDVSVAGKAGWSWGGQFADFDNDGRQDLYVCSGFFTAPEKFASTVDL